MAEVIYSGALSGGAIDIPPSKSAAHRALLCAALSKGSCTLSNILHSQDIDATADAIRAFGATVEFSEESKSLTVDASSLGAHGGEIDCGESGSTLRFIIPIAAALGGLWRFVGHGRLPQRPLGIYAELLPRHGVKFHSEGGLPLEIEGKLTAGEYSLPGNVSSQFVTGLLFALPLLEDDSKIILTSPLESKGYVDMTISMLEKFGVEIEEKESGWDIRGGQKYRPQNIFVEGDWSQAAFFLSMAALDSNGSKIKLRGLDPASLQGDKACVEIFSRFGLDIKWEEDALVAQNLKANESFGGLHGITIDASQIPDMVPALSVCAALSRGETKIVKAERLRLKESDRLAAMEQAINALGGKVITTEDGLIIDGVKKLRGGKAEGQNDHRVVMALSAAALRSKETVTVTDARSIRKSYPNFFEDFISLGGSADVIDMG